MTNYADIDALPLPEETKTILRDIRDLHVLRGTAVRCPACRAGKGKWCIGPDGRMSSAVSHDERVALAR